MFFSGKVSGKILTNSSHFWYRALGNFPFVFNDEATFLIELIDMPGMKSCLSYIQSLFGFFFGIIKPRKDIRFKSNYDARQYWERKKQKLRVNFAFLIIVYVLSGFEMSTPNYSLTTEIANRGVIYFRIISHIVSKNSKDEGVKSDLFEKTPNEKERIFNDLNNGNIVELGRFLKFFVYLSFVLIFIFAFTHLDPFSNRDLLVNLVSNDKYKRLERYFPALKDLKKYAEVLPSNYLYFACANCQNSPICKNSLTNDRYLGVELWSKIFGSLHPDDVNKNLETLYTCRLWHFFKYTLLYCSLLLSAVYLGVRFLELAMSNLEVIPNWELILLISISFIMFLGLHIADPSIKSIVYGAKTFYSTNRFKKALYDFVCNRVKATEKYSPISSNGYTSIDELKYYYQREIEKLKMTTESISMINNQLIANMIGYPKINNLNREPIIRSILAVITGNYELLYDNHKLFRASILIPEDNHLNTWLTHPSWNNHENNSDMVIDADINKIFDIKGSSIASKAWSEKKAISANNSIPMIYGGQSDNLKSIIAFPLVFPKDFYFKINENNHSIGEVFGVLCVTSSDKNVFTKENCEINTTILTPYISMINYHYARRLEANLNPERN